MSKTKKQVVLLFGGKSGEHEVSIVSAFSVRKALDSAKYSVRMIGIDKSGRWVLPSEELLNAHAAKPRTLDLSQVAESVTLLPYSTEAGFMPLQATAKAFSADVIIPILHGTNGEDGTIQGLLELSGIPFVGSGVLGSANGMDKDFAKRLFKGENIPVVPWLVLNKLDFKKSAEALINKIEASFSYPFFVKPANMGSSVGVHKVKNRAEALTKIADAFLYDTKVLAEEAISARELEISVRGNSELKASIVGEIIPTHEFYSYEAKYLDENGAALKIPAENLTATQTKALQEMAMKAFKALGCLGLARVDFFMDKGNGAFYLNEVNTIPGFTSISMYPKLWQASGLAYPDLLDELIRLAIEIREEKNSLKTSFN